ncbi:MAG: helix-turn-helix domain-containing protein, partial [Oscillospiraceae bacterium]
MPWKEKTVEMEREEFVKRVLSKEKSKSELCREYGISRPTGDKWIARCMNGNSFENKSRAPFHTANKTDSQIEEQLLKYRHEHPAIGA